MNLGGRVISPGVSGPEAADQIVEALNKSFAKFDAAWKKHCESGDGDDDEDNFLSASCIAKLVDVLPPIGDARDFMQDVLKQESGTAGRVLLQSLFGDCVRVARVHATVESVKCLIEETEYRDDKRISECLAACQAVEQVLKDFGLAAYLGKILDGARQRLNGAAELCEGETASVDVTGGYPAGPATDCAAPPIAVVGEAIAGKVLNYPRDQILHIAVLSAKDLAKPSYRIGDQTKAAAHALGLKETLTTHKKVYMHLQCKGDSRKTEEACSEAGTATVNWQNEDHYFDLSLQGDVTLKLKVFDRRKKQRLLLGDPRVGEKTITLGEHLRDGETHVVPVTLQRYEGEYEFAGTVELAVTFEPTYGVAPSCEAAYGVMQCTADGVHGWLFHTKKDAEAKYNSLKSTNSAMWVCPDSTEMAYWGVQTSRKDMIKWFRDARKEQEQEKAAARLRQGDWLWEFAVRDGFAPFDAECQDFIEARFMEYKIGCGQPVTEVKSRGKTVLVDFQDPMSQHVQGDDGCAGRKREVRRRGGEFGFMPS